jgi:hypothetical protein
VLLAFSCPAMSDKVDMCSTAFPALNDANYPKWSMRMEADLICKKLFGEAVMFEDEQGEAETAEEYKARVEKWLVKQTKTKMVEARAEIIRRVSNDQLIYCANPDPHMIWEELRMVHQACRLAMRISMQRRLYKAKKSSLESMSLWIARINQLANRLAAAGASVDEEDQILALTMGLDASYEVLIVALDSLPPDELTVQNITARLINEEVRRNQDKCGADGQYEWVEVNFAHAAIWSSGNGGAGGPRKPRACWICGSMDHLKNNCPDRTVGHGGGSPGRQAAGMAVTGGMANLAF